MNHELLQNTHFPSDVLSLILSFVKGPTDTILRKIRCEVSSDLACDLIAFHSDRHFLFVMNKNLSQIFGFIHETVVNFLITGPELNLQTFGVAVHSLKNQVYVSDIVQNRILLFSIDDTNRLTFLKQWGSRGSENGQFHQPNGIAVDSMRNRVLVADTWNHRICVFDLVGLFEFEFGSGELKCPMCVTVDSYSNFIFVSDHFHHRICVFGSDGTFQRSFGGLRYPCNIVIHSKQQRIYVVDGDDLSIAVFGFSGIFVRKINILCKPKFSIPIGLTLDESENELYFAVDDTIFVIKI